MTAELATALLALATLICVALCGCGIATLRQPRPTLHALAIRLSVAVTALVGGAFLLLVTAYVQSDFSVANVLENSHTAKPLLYKITGTWGNHEGSMLLWVWFLSVFSAAFALYRPVQGNTELHTLALAVLGFIVLGFLLFILLTSNPFARIAEPPMEGQDLNPLLQDIGLALHPPLLYLGYVGFAIVFAWVVAALAMRLPINSHWAKPLQPWVLLAWSFLTAGIGLGSWWAYRELGWGGWWFWDPVENISLLPWLSGTALLHCLLILAKRTVLQNWTLLLGIFTFSFCLLGTFLVRSGLLTSVHSFASDPTRGLYVLAFIAVLCGGALWLYTVRFPRPSAPDFSPISREGGILLNNLLLTTLCVTVLLGILYPLLMQVLDLQAVSVGAPYYNTVVVPVALPMLLLAGIAPLITWRHARWKTSRRPLQQALRWMAITVVIIIILLWPYLRPLLAMPMAVLAAICGIWMLCGSITYWRRQRHAYPRISALPTSAWGMTLAHAGLAIFTIAAAFSSAGRIEREFAVNIGDVLSVAGYELELASLTDYSHANYHGQTATLHVRHGESSFTLYPESRFYPARAMETAEAAIHSDLRRDVYAAIATMAEFGHSDGNNRPVILRFYMIPAMTWLWLGILLSCAGGFIASHGYFRK